ncbi:hypothetical protein BH23BAC1_BH23BAC1_25700 [soil metagenome]
MNARIICILFLTIGAVSSANGQHTIARKWNEVLLASIRNDLARPTIHARNLFHTSVAMYDAWAAYDDQATPFLLGQTVVGFYCPFQKVANVKDVEKSREEAISYAAYRILTYRFRDSPGAGISLALCDSLMKVLGYDASFTSVDYSEGSAAALGNYIAKNVIEFGLQDGSNEFDYYKNKYYKPVNPPLTPTSPGNPDITHPDRWQPLDLITFIDQSGNVIPGSSPPFLSPEWGKVKCFALSSDNVSILERDGDEYWIYYDPGPPPYLKGEFSDDYKWGFSLVSIWSSHLDPDDGVMLDISPGAMGNNKNFPDTWADHREFYDTFQGGDHSTGHAVNPYTGLPYEPQVVPRGDYARVLAEFWADGPESETPPGHWFTILNYVSDHPLFEKKLGGEGPLVDDLEWDVKTYLTLGGAMHDCAVAIWSIKGYYDYIRPISAIRYMSDKNHVDAISGNFSEYGIPLVPDFIELVAPGDPLAGLENENVGKIKLYTWRGHEYIADPAKDIAGAGWILAENWWPYQRPSFVTPPFAGYVSGHSGFSRAAAEVMTLLTGSEYFPGGLGEFHAPKNDFLVFEAGPSVDVTLQWATYRDASDQTSLSRIWGGIHAPADDIKGRIIGEKIGVQAFTKAKQYFNGLITSIEDRPYVLDNPIKLYPNPVSGGEEIIIEIVPNAKAYTLKLINHLGQTIRSEYLKDIPDSGIIRFKTDQLPEGLYLINIENNNKALPSLKLIIR